ncbi:MAG: hypothetical protein PHG66_02350 [Candidatus Colwellbacteria bacterium]|nr:hypothetical protein [Candidatus Colwellbacteria bacterium]
MFNRLKISTYIVSLIFGAFLMSGISLADTTVICANGPSIRDSGGCGTSCVGLCSDSSFLGGATSGDCLYEANNFTEPWAKYNAKRVDLSSDWGDDWAFSFTLIRDRICSTADKYNSGGDTTLMRAGRCDCTSGGIYKACCGSNDPTQAVEADRYSVDTTNPPYEAGCSNGTVTRINSSTIRCPANPAISLYATKTNIKAGESTTLSWTVSGTDECTISPSVAGANFPNESGASVSPTTTTKYTITCTSPYQVLAHESGGWYWRDRSLPPDVNSITITVDDTSVTATATPACISPSDPQYKSSDHSSVVAWTSSGAQKCSVSPALKASTSISLNGSETVAPAATTTYNFTCTEKADGSGKSASGSAKVTVRNCSRESVSNPGTYVEWFDPDGKCDSDYDNCRYESGITKKYYYCQTAAASCIQTSSEYPATAAGKAQCETNLQTYLPGQTSGVCYSTANCDGTCGAASFTVNLTATPSSITRGSCSSLSWSSVGATNCSIDQGIGNVGTGGTRSVCPVATTTYALTCHDIASPATTKQAAATVTVNDPAGCYSGPTAVTASITASPRECLPGQPGQITDTNLNWSGTANNMCSSIIGGGSPSSYSLSCSNSSSNWSGSGSGNNSISGTYHLTGVNSTQSYALQCTRSQFTCSSAQTFAVHDDNNHQRCIDSCNSLRSSYPAVNSCNCSQSSCIEYWSDEAHCTQHACGTTHTVHYSCNCDSCCSESCSGTPPSCHTSCSSCNCDTCSYEACNYDGPCIAWSCRYYGENQSVSSKTVCSSADSDSQTVRFIQKPIITDFTPSKTQILLNQFLDIMWTSVAPDSGTSTILRCTPGVQGTGDPKNWADVGYQWLNAFASSGNTAGTNKHPMPNRTTTYSLFCRNNDQILCGSSPTGACQCYNDSDTRTREVKVFEPQLKEKSPSFKDSVVRALGSMREAIDRLAGN